MAKPPRQLGERSRKTRPVHMYEETYEALKRVTAKWNTHMIEASRFLVELADEDCIVLAVQGVSDPEERAHILMESYKQEHISYTEMRNGIMAAMHAARIDAIDKWSRVRDEPTTAS